MPRILPLEALWSPQQISAWLAETYPDAPEMQVSHETIYQSLFVQSHGALKKELAQLLAKWAGHATGQGLHRGRDRWSPAHQHGDDLRAAGRGRRPGRPGPLGRRPHLREEDDARKAINLRSQTVAPSMTCANAALAPPIRRFDDSQLGSPNLLILCASRVGDLDAPCHSPHSPQTKCTSKASVLVVADHAARQAPRLQERSIRARRKGR